MKRATPVFFAIGLILALVFCGPPPQKVVTVEYKDHALQSAEAGRLAGEGHYVALKKAVRAYGELYANRKERRRIAAPYAEACLLLALREREIGIDNPATLAAARKLIGENGDLARLEPYAVVISTLPVRTLGTTRDIVTSGAWDMARARAIAAAVETVVKTGPASEFAAAVLAARSCPYGAAVADRRSDAAACLKAFPDSPLLRYEAALCGGGEPRPFEDLLARHPGFAEAHYDLGSIILKQGRLIEAETHLLKAGEAIPESPQINILLAGIYFATEEFDKGLQFYDLTLGLSPEYRDALLGKAVCLTYLGRRDEAMAVLERILELGYWLIGEAHYWLAWNLHDLKREAEALGHADEAKGRLPTNTEVFELAGTIALELGQTGRAEKDFLESLKYDPANAESLFGLGTIAGRKSLWAEAAGYYEKAGRALAALETATRNKIAEIRASAFSEERKARLVRKRELQVERLRLTEATAWYDAAAAWLNAGVKDKAVAAAARSAAHPGLKDKTEELLRSVKN